MFVLIIKKKTSGEGWGREANESGRNLDLKKLVFLWKQRLAKD